MNENMLRGPGESILLMAGGSHGKLVNATRVFTTVEAFREYVQAHATVREAYPGHKAGDVVYSHVVSWGTKKGSTVQTILVRPGNFVSMYGQLYVSSPDKPPKRFELTAEMIGLVSVKTKQKTIKPST